jgi:hypothetical protein
LGADVALKIFLPETPDFATELASNFCYWISPTRVIATTSTDDEFKNLSVVTDYLAVGHIKDLVVDADSFQETHGVHPGGSICNAAAFNDLEKKLRIAGRTVISPSDLLALRDQAGIVAAGIALAKATGKEFYHRHTTLSRHVIGQRGVLATRLLAKTA